MGLKKFDVLFDLSAPYRNANDSFKNYRALFKSLKIFKGYTKLLVGVGSTEESEKRTEVEIIDLETSSSSCSDLRNFSHAAITAIGGLEFNNNPFICGGYFKKYYFLDDPQYKCLSWSNSAWQDFSHLTEERKYASSCPSPFFKDSHKLLVAGGIDGGGILGDLAKKNCFI